MPYQGMLIGPSWNAIGPGVTSIIGRPVYSGSPQDRLVYWRPHASGPRPVNAEFNWWLLIVGLVAGAGLVWLVIADWSRRDEDLSEDERQAESAWIAQILLEQGERLDPEDAEHVLALHRAYLRQSGGLEPEE